MNIVDLRWFSDKSHKTIFYKIKIRNHVDKYVYVITKHYHQLMPLSLATYCKSKSKKTRKLWSEGYALGYASGKILKISNFLKYSPRLYPQATPEGK
ncbi:hypothetical protein T12_12490 [Trichinella patagoniensis]|uniref:Uncharacterized protein n=1 Tax=Trichinella patagoniensis TaxID=990121 RepID=A0A0V0ZU68_9BILA|nr:hypothetical protein T12_12490 [Trichinella patagoniensis]